MQLQIKEIRTTALPKAPIIPLENAFLPNPFTINPIKGKRGINQINSLIVFIS